MSFIAAIVAAAAMTQDAARNPILYADVPDPSIVRVGDWYYMSSTTMHMSPGLPIMASRDLVNWEMASYAYDTLGEEDTLRLENGKNAYGGGSWASSLRYRDGKFYVSTFSFTTGYTYIYSTQNPRRSPWTQIAKFRPVLHDSSLFWDDDGRVYMVSGGGNLRLTELASDLSGPKPGGVNKIIVPNATAVAGGEPGLPAEGSHLYKIDGRYYLCNIAWPKGGMRTALIHRADRIDGPYEGRIMFQDRGIAQGGLVDSPDGKWFAYLFQDRGAVGRIPWLIPVQWRDGWPVLGTDGKAPETLPLPAGPGARALVASDDFDRKPDDPPFGMAWQWNHNPIPGLWSLTARPGFLRLTTGRVDREVVDARNTLTQRTFGPTSQASVILDPAGLRVGDTAGLVALQRQYGFVGVKRTAEGDRLVVVTAPDAKPSELVSVPIESGPVELRIACDFRNGVDRATFAYRQGTGEWKSLDATLQMRYDLPHFMGYRFGLFAFSTETAGGHADFDAFRIGP